MTPLFVDDDQNQESDTGSNFGSSAASTSEEVCIL